MLSFVALALAAVVFVALLLFILPVAYLGAPPPGFAEVFLLTALFSGAAAGLGLLPGLAVAVWGRGGWRAAVAQILYAPAVVPPTAVGVLLLAAFRNPLLPEWLYGFFVNKAAGVLLAMFVMALPVSYAVFDGALKDVRAELYFRSLGLGGLRLLAALLLSLRRAAAAAFLLSFLRGFGELGVLLIFASYPPTMSIYIYQAFLQEGLGATVAASMAVAALGVSTAYLLRLWLSR
ncbi:sulfate ABC transporter permease [Pyrobaculum neutrophilum]|uniref:Sulfate ABC transporter, permease protein, putative n=1 Tax=Pyrobaculum neutrophilum (strain DSM 2338 / JCM 9278 / NBRC 100436 / V24Sta) TaxID=444157 RepID=B1YDP9_PYRNV|nr:sulfate ABC transporter permease [Pyrobaculum neutrophilum]ACB39912.1 sulfate ABC transporter, permease protein, putative [Pyrobaculum neutrophilum V24Sta]